MHELYNFIVRITPSRGVMFTSEWISVNSTLKIGVTPVAGNSHQLSV